ncbi:MAG: 30S ribosomal protein S24e [Thermoproteales archaeon]|nr:30S ribosomal protein S24e [Thermoproteales archaeon]
MGLNTQSVDNIEVLVDKRNNLLKRKEIKVRVTHSFKGTPSRQTIRQLIAQMFKVPIETVIIRKIITEYGFHESIAEIHIYDTPEIAKSIEPEFILLRNMPELKERQQG